MLIEILCTDGSPLGVSSKTIWGDGWRIGVGGAELALLTMCEEWTKAGHEVVLYNNPKEQNASPFEQRHTASFDPNGKRDVLVVFRTPNPKAIAACNCLKVWWSCDQYTSVDFKSFAPFVDKIVGISPTHKKYFESTYGIGGMEVIDLPVRVDDYINAPKPERNPRRFIFNSVPDRGLDNLWRVWPSIVKKFPDVSLTILSDYRLWGVGANNEKHRVKWIARENFEFIGAVDRARMIQEQLKSGINLYQCSYEELFCIACAENMVAGVIPVTSSAGALSTTNMGTIAFVDANDPRNDWIFIDHIERNLSDPILEENRIKLYNAAVDRFSPMKILKQWDERIFK